MTRTRSLRTDRLKPLIWLSTIGSPTVCDLLSCIGNPSFTRPTVSFRSRVARQICLGTMTVFNRKSQSPKKKNLRPPGFCSFHPTPNAVYGEKNFKTHISFSNWVWLLDFRRCHGVCVNDRTTILSSKRTNVWTTN